jgi:threonine dehydratase
LPLDYQRDVEAALARIKDHVRRTPCQHSPRLSKETGAEVFLKLENFQVTGSFKARGAAHKLLSLSPEQRAQGVVSASSGNHGAGVAYAAKTLGVKARVYVPEVADPTKIEAIQSHGAEVIVRGADCVDAESAARSDGKANGQPYISPYNDVDVLLGQGTVGAEIAAQIGHVDAVFVALGGGGLISGIGGYLKALNSSTAAVACSPERSPAMHECLLEGRIIDVPCYDTFSDATAGGVEEGSITFETCRDVIDQSLLLSEEEIAAATRSLIDGEHLLVEGAAGLALAGFLKSAEAWQGKRVVIILCGANIGKARLREILAGT